MLSYPASFQAENQHNIIVVLSIVLINPKDPTIGLIVAVSIAFTLMAIPFLIKVKKADNLT